MDDLPVDPEPVILAELINRYAKARVAKSWIGTYPPAEKPRIRRKLKRSREQLESHILSEFGVEVKLD